MAPDEIVSELTGRLSDPSEAVFVVTMRDLVAAIARRLQEESLHLTADQLLLARDELRSVFEHYLDERELFDLALDQWEVVRHL